MRSSFGLSAFRMLLIPVASAPEVGDTKDQLKFIWRPPPPKDWKPERVRFPQDEILSGPSKKRKLTIKITNSLVRRYMQSVNDIFTFIILDYAQS